MNNKTEKFITLMIMLAFTGSAYSENDIANTVTQNTVSKNSIVLSASSTSAKDWNLTDDEWKSYQNLMQSAAGYYYAKLTPPEVLGLYATNDNELRHYAEIHAKLEHEKVERELKLDKAFHEAALRLYPDEPIVKSFDMSAFTPIKKDIDYNNEALRFGDRLVLFIDINDINHNSEVLALTNQIKSHGGVILDIYFINVKTDADIKRWARANQIPVSLVSSNQITLNNDNGRFKKIVSGHTLPTAMRIRDGKSNYVNMEDL